MTHAGKITVCCLIGRCHLRQADFLFDIVTRIPRDHSALKMQSKHAQAPFFSEGVYRGLEFVPLDTPTLWKQVIALTRLAGLD